MISQFYFKNSLDALFEDAIDPKTNLISLFTNIRQNAVSNMGTFKNYVPTSFCQHSFWMPPMCFRFDLCLHQ